MKKLIVLLAVLQSALSFAGDVPWLDKVSTPSADVISTAPLRPDLLVDKQGHKITSISEWNVRRQEIRKDWLKILGPLPQAPSDGFKLTTISNDDLATCTRRLVKYEAEPGRYVRAYIIRLADNVIRPANDGSTSHPGVVVFHPTNVDSIKVVAGTGGRPEQHLALHLAERGFVVICPENYINEEPTWKAAVVKAKQRHPHSLGMATMLADGMRAVDVLMAQPGVDPDRIATIGHSLGAKEVIYLMAFDERVKAGASSEGGVGINFSNWNADWYLGPKAGKPDFGHDQDELLALIAPRPLLFFGGETGRAADGDRTWPYIFAANAVYELYEKPARMGFINHRQDHTFSQAMADKAFEWLTTYVGN